MRKAIVQAILRIQNGRPKVVEAGRRMSIAAVAEEAGTSRANIHNNHPELADRINGLGNKAVRAQRDQKHSQLKEERQKNREYRDEINELRDANNKMATQLAMLTDENERLLAERNSKKVVHLRS